MINPFRNRVDRVIALEFLIAALFWLAVWITFR